MVSQNQTAKIDLPCKTSTEFSTGILMNFPARHQFVTDLTKTNISCKKKKFYQNVPFEFNSPTSSKLLAEFWGSTTKTKIISKLTHFL